MAQASPLRTIFLDLDDTLAHTSAADRLAYAQCRVQLHSALAQQQAPLAGLPTRCDAVVATFKEVFKAAPWAPSSESGGDGNGAREEMPVVEWRAQLWQQALDRHCPADGATAAAAAISGAKLQAIFDETRLAALDFFPGALEAVEQLRSAGYPLVIITNGHKDIQRAKLAAPNISPALDKFDHIIVGGEQPFQKPHPSIFATALQRVNLEAKDAIHVGDSLSTDVAGGIAAGLQATVWVNAEGRTRAGGSPEPTYEIRNIVELPGLIEKLASAS